MLESVRIFVHVRAHTHRHFTFPPLNSDLSGLYVD